MRFDLARILSWFYLGMTVYFLITGNMVAAGISIVAYFAMDMRADVNDLQKLAKSKVKDGRQKD